MEKFYPILTLLVFAICPVLYGQNSLYTFQKSPAGLSYIHHLTTSDESQVSFSIRSGSVYETDSSYGINQLIALILEKRISKSKSLATSIQDINVSPENVVIDFKCPNKLLEDNMSDLAYCLFSFAILEDELAWAKEKLQTKYDTLLLSKEYRNRFDLQKRLWRNDAQKVFANSISKQFLNISLAKVNDYYQKYYQKSNSTMAFSTSKENNATFELMKKLFTTYNTQFFNPEQIIRLLELKPIINYSQHIYYDESSSTPMVGVLFQNPGVRYDRKGAYCATILAQILEKQTDFELKSNLKLHNYFSAFYITKSVSDNQYVFATNELNELIDTLKTLHYISPSMFAAAKDNIITQYKKVSTQQPFLFLKEIAKYRFSSDDKFITSFADSIQSVTMEDMQQYLYEYFINKAGIHFINTDSASFAITPQKEKVYDIDESIKHLKCMFELNKTDLSGDSNQVVIDKITQWMKMNTDAYLLINGFADKGEYHKVSDDEISKFIDSIPDFKKVKPFFIKTNTLRPEMMRALKVMKLLYDNGIPIARLKGTSMVLSSQSDQESIENKKCTFDIEKRKSSIAFYTLLNSKK